MKWKAWRRSAGAALLLSTSVLGPSPTALAQPQADVGGAPPGAASQQAEAALQRVAQANHLSAGNLQVVASASQRYPEVGMQLQLTKVLDGSTGATYLDAVDAQGRGADPQAAATAEEAARLAKNGKVTPSLQKALNGAGQATVKTTIWLNAPEGPLSRPGVTPSVGSTVTVAATETAEASDQSDSQLAPAAVNSGAHDAARAAQASLLGAAGQRAGNSQQGLLGRLSRMGVQVKVSRYAPVIFADLTRAQIQQLSRDPDVSAMYGPEQYQVMEDDATTTSRTYRTWAAGNLGAGAAVRPAVHEPDGIADGNPFLNNGTHPVIFYCAAVSANCPSGKNIDAHSSEVAGVISSTHPLIRGQAPNAAILFSENSQTFDDSDLVDAFEWGLGNGAAPTNLSWGTVCFSDQTFWSRYADYATRNLAATLVIAAGNSPACGVSAPGIGFNVITVGSQFDNNDGFWGGDGMSPFSAANEGCVGSGNCAGDFNKPEVVAVGSDVVTTDNAGGDWLTAGGVNGTSFATPQVAGQVALMLSRQPGQNIWPETNKAAVIASAYHDIVAGTEDDGNGAIVVPDSDATYLNNRFANSFFGSADVDKDFVVALTAGKVYRAAIAWDSISNGSTSDVLGADIDLHIIKPDNTLLTGSFSVGNAFEAVTFTAPVSGNYKFRAHKFSAIGTWPGTFLGMAYSLRDLPNFCTGQMSSVSLSGQTFTVNTQNYGTFYDTYPTVVFNESGRERWFKITIPAATTKNIKVTDTNVNMDLIIATFPGNPCTENKLTPTVLGFGLNSAQVANAGPGVYYVSVDGFNGTVGTTTVTFSFPTTLSASDDITPAQAGR